LSAGGFKHRVDLDRNHFCTFGVWVQFVTKVFVVEAGADVGQRYPVFVTERFQPWIVEIPLGVDFAGDAWREQGFVGVRYVE
jgi:hypothetical protein